VDLPSFLWLWRIAAWSMGLAVIGYLLLALSGGGLAYLRLAERASSAWLRPLHVILGSGLVLLVVVLLAIGIVGTLGEYGTLGHSIHLPLGLAVVALVLVSAWSASRIAPHRPWARKLHLALNGILGLALMGAGLSGWQVVQKYLP
jgi:ABC-type amino acid transport system permease subunit